MRIIYFGHYSALTGYGRACRDYCACLRAAGHDLQIVDWQSIPGNTQRAVGAPEPRFRALDDCLVPWPLALGDGDVAIVHGSPKLLATVMAQGALPPGGRRLAMTTWETSTIPREFVEQLGFYEQILVPSGFCRDVIRAAIRGSNDAYMQRSLERVQIVPHTFDPDWLAPAPVSTPKLVNFYSVGTWGERKNHEAVIKAYLHAFTPDEPVHLTIVSTASEGQRVTHAFQSVLARSGLAPGRVPSIELVHEPLGDAAMRELIQRQGVYVNASRGEGWGLSVFEAALAGQIILSTLQTGEQDYLTRYTQVHEIDSRLTPCFAGPGLPIVRDGQVVGEKTVTVPGMNAQGHWIDIDIIDLADAMRRFAVKIIESPDDERAAATRTRNHAMLVERYGYANVAQIFAAVL